MTEKSEGRLLSSFVFDLTGMLLVGCIVHSLVIVKCHGGKQCLQKAK